VLPLIRQLVTIETDYTKIAFEGKQLENVGRCPDELFSLLRGLELYSLFNVMKYSLLIDKVKTD
jgi:hypothetical protein